MDIRFENVNNSYDKEKIVVQNLSFAMKGKGSYGIVGESGSGKTTLSASIAKSLTDLKGEIRIADQNILEITYRLANAKEFDHIFVLHNG